MKDVPPSWLAFFGIFGFRRIGVTCPKLKPIISTPSESAFFLPFLTEGYPLERNPWKSVCLLGPFWGVGLKRTPQIEHSDVVDIMGFNFRHVATILRKTENGKKKQSRRWGVFRFWPLKSLCTFVKGPKKAVSGGKMVDLGGRKRKTSHLCDWLFLPFFGFP